MALVLLGLPGAFASPPPDDPLPLVPGDALHDPGVPPPARVLGYEIGDRMTDHAGTIRYLRALEASSRRVRLTTYGTSHQGRDLVYAVISHPDNLAHLDAIRLDIAALADPRRLDRAGLESILGTTPVVVWLSHGIHGNEHSSTEAALVTAWHLASARDERTIEQLRRTVVLIDPVLNPDGRERFLAYQREVAGPAPRAEPDAADHDEPWPSGRYNHMLFDLNRDWFHLTQPETRGRIAAYLEWMPQVHVDFHEMGSESTYYFPPPADPVNTNTPAPVPEWWEVFGRANAAAFDAAGFDYFTSESFDGFFPGYGDSWPSFHGAVGMTYEQASARGFRYRRRDGTEFTLRDAVHHHVTASLATLATAADHREALLRDFVRARREAIDAGREGPVRTWIITRRSPGDARNLVSLLLAQGIEVHRAAAPFSMRVRSWRKEEARTVRFEEGDYLVSAAQPAGRLLTALMEQDPRLSDAFLGEEEERRRLNERSAIYDVTAWSLPILTGADVRWSSERMRTDAHPVRPADLAPQGGIADPAGAGPRDGARPPYAWLIPYDDNAALSAIVILLREDVPMSVAGRDFRIGKKRFSAGTAIVRARGDAAALRGKVAEAARRAGVTVHEVATGLTDEGPDLGSNHVVPITLPRIAVVYGPPTRPPSLGALMHLFDRIYGIPYTPVRAPRLVATDLSRYDVIVLPDGGGNPSWKGSFGATGAARLKGWVESGGTLITLGRATAWAADEEVGLATIRRLGRAGGKEDGEPAEPAEGGSGDEEWPDEIPGAILRVSIEPRRAPAFGYAREGAVMVNSDLAFSLSEKGRNIVTFAPVESIRISGFAWKESLEVLAGSAYLVEEPMGHGRVILFTEDPNFRGAWDSLNRLFVNCIVYARAFESGS